MVPHIRYVHARLEEWARWAKDDTSLGFPSRSVHEKVNEGGILAGAARPPTEIPEAVAYTDAAIAAQIVIDRTVLRAYYLNWAPTETLWQRCAGIRSVSNFKAVLRRARWRVWDHLEHSECG